MKNRDACLYRKAKRPGRRLHMREKLEKRNNISAAGGIFGLGRRVSCVRGRMWPRAL